MDWLNDRKNLPLVVGASVFIVLGAVAWILYSMGYLNTLQSSTRFVPDTPETGMQRFQPQVVAGAPPPPSLSSIKLGSTTAAAKPPPKKVAVKPVVVASTATPAVVKPLATPAVVKPIAPPVLPTAKNATLVNGKTTKPLAPVANPRLKVAAKPVGAKPGAKPGAPGAVAAAPPEPPMTSESVLHGKDPFYVAGVAPVRKGTVQIAAMVPPLVVPAINIYRVKQVAQMPQADPNAPPVEGAAGGRRVSGIMYSNGVYAILESNGQSVSVQPGDQVDGDRVVSIQSDGVILRTPGNVLVHVPLSDGGGGGSAAVSAGNTSASNYQNYIPPAYRH